MISIIDISIEEFMSDIYDKYIKLFPKNEQRKWNKIEETYRNGIEHFYKVNLDNKTIGFIMLEKIDNYPYYMDYFAIYSEYQNKGYGSKIVKSLIENIIHNDGLIGEIEKVDDNNIQTKKRLKFYKNLGFVEVDSEYLLYDVNYTPLVYLDNGVIENIDEIFFKYYLVNVGKDELEKNCKIIKHD